MNLGTFALDLVYLAVFLLADVLLLMAAGLIAASFLYGLFLGTAFMIRNE